MSGGDVFLAGQYLVKTRIVPLCRQTIENEMRWRTFLRRSKKVEPSSKYDTSYQEHIFLIFLYTFPVLFDMIILQKM